MVRRHPHTAVITVEPGSLENGEWVKGEPSERIIRGLYFASNSGNQVKVNADGRECIVHGEFSTREEPIEGASRLRIDSEAVDVPIICWEKFQTHSVIYV